MGYISDTARNRTHNLFRPKREPIPGHNDGCFLHPTKHDTLGCQTKYYGCLEAMHCLWLMVWWRGRWGEAGRGRNCAAEQLNSRLDTADRTTNRIAQVRNCIHGVSIRAGAGAVAGGALRHRRPNGSISLDQFSQRSRKSVEGIDPRLPQTSSSVFLSSETISRHLQKIS